MHSSWAHYNAKTYPMALSHVADKEMEVSASWETPEFGHLLDKKKKKIMNFRI